MLLLIICICTQSDLFNCDKGVNAKINESDMLEDHQHNLQDNAFFIDRPGRHEKYLNSSTVLTTVDHKLELTTNTELTVDRIMSTAGVDETGLNTSQLYLTQRDHEKLKKSLLNPSKLYHNSKDLNHQAYVFTIPQFSSSRYSSKDYLLSFSLSTPTSSIQRPGYTPDLRHQRQRVSVPSRIEDPRHITNSSQLAKIYTPNSAPQKLLTPPSPGFSDDISKTFLPSIVLPTNQSNSNTILNTAPASIPSEKKHFLRRILSTRSEFEMIFRKEMAGFTAVDRFVLTHSVMTRVIPHTSQTTERTKPVARSQTKARIRKTRMKKQLNITTTPHNDTTMMLSTKGIVEEITNATSPSKPARTRPVTSTTLRTSDLDLGISTATGKQEQFFVEDQHGFLQVGTTPAADEQTKTTIVEGRPAYIPHDPTTPTTAGDVLYGVIKVPPSTERPRLQVYHHMMERLDEGYMIVFLIQLCKLVALKPADDVQAVIIHTEMIVNDLFQNGRLAWFGHPLLDVTLQLSIFVTEAEIDVKKSYGAMMHHMLKERKQALSTEVNSIIDYADLLYTHAEGEQLFNVLKDFEMFPNLTLTGYWLCDSLIEVFLRPYRRLQNSPRRQRLLDSINRALETRFPHFRFRRPREKVMRLNENNVESSKVSTYVTTDPYNVTTSPHGRLRKRKKKRKRYHPSHRHSRGKRHNHTGKSDENIFRRHFQRPFTTTT